MPDSHRLPLVLAVAGDWFAFASDHSSVLALALVASVSFVEGLSDVDHPSLIVAFADFVIADDVSVGIAFTSLATVSMVEFLPDLVFHCSLLARASLVATDDVTSLSARACVTSVGVDP